MILTGLNNLIYLVVGSLLDVLPQNYGLPSVIHTAATALNAQAMMFDPIFPVHELFQLFDYSLVIVSAVMTVKFALLVFGFIRGANYNAGM